MYNTQMLTCILKIFFLLSLFFHLVFSKVDNSLEKIKLQLQWKHQFEFAGFYTAQEILEGNRQYSITYTSIIAEYLSAKPIVLVANIFK